MEQFTSEDELALYCRLLTETTDVDRRRILLLLIACVFEEEELSTGVGLKSIATRMHGADFSRLH
ncbi:MAG: hypothetical protein HXX15_20920 [Rhodopseudomonas sp.]|uniref:hypothetical protein n=1 Tax=Rhodopseudomonas sp. TaxID=1078 RepID=UPI0017DCBB04|nr:hypothetical protein [Rhodopseudomonas sp.]NVN88550.1 hypothetical protein [Rhodopseudomonas sp.]